MKPELEQIPIESSQQSIHFFKLETEAFRPYWHYHPEIELTYIIKGEGTRFIGNSIAPFTKNDLVLIGENIPHNWVSLKHSSSKIQEAIVFQFNASLFSAFKECASFYKLFELAKRGIQFQEPSKEIIKRILNFEKLTDIQRLSSFLELLSELNAHKHQKLLATEIYLQYHNQQHKIEKFAKVNDYILTKFDQKLTVSHMADVTNMVPQSFCRWFKQHAGYSFVSFLNRTRIENACQLLIHSAIPVQEIAFSSGFESLSHFNRTFKELKKMSPSQFKKAIDSPIS
jgi:AraC-like DNA-binding protein